MIKQGVKNFFVCLKYFFTPIGTMFLGITLGLSVLLPGIASAFATVIREINALSADISLNFSQLAESFMQVMGELRLERA